MRIESATLHHSGQGAQHTTSLYSHPKEFWEMKSDTMLAQREKIPSTGRSEEDQTQDTASLRTVNPTHYRCTILTLLLTCFKSASFRIVNPTHYRCTILTLLLTCFKSASFRIVNPTHYRCTILTLLLTCFKIVFTI